MIKLYENWSSVTLIKKKKKAHIKTFKNAPPFILMHVHT